MSSRFLSTFRGFHTTRVVGCMQTASEPVQQAAQWTPESKRTGVLAVKIGMLPVWDEWGFRHNCTVLQVNKSVE